MTDLMVVLALAMLPALGHFSGAVAAERLRASPRNLNRALHAAAGIVIAIVAVELTPRALEATSHWVIALAFALGGLAYVGIEVTSRACSGSMGKLLGGRACGWFTSRLRWIPSATAS